MPQKSSVPSPEGYPVIGHAAQFARSPFHFVENAIEECGDLYRMELPGTDVYVMAHPEHFRRALVTDIDLFGKTDDFQQVFGNGLLSTESEQWSRQREIMQPLFGRDRINGYAPHMVEATEQRLLTWRDGETRDMESEMQDLTLEILFATLFGRTLSPGEGENLREASDGLNRWFTPTSWLMPPWVPTPARREFSESSERLRTEVDRLLAEQAYGSQQTDDDRPDGLIAMLQQAREASGEDHMSKEEVEDQMLTMIFAGYETTAAALAFAWFSLATNPEIRREFHDELDTVLNGDLPSPENVDDLKFTNRIVKETLRLYPPVHTIPRQTTEPVDVDGYRIPGDEQVHLSVIALHRNERYYDEPKSFRPDRWTDNFEEELDEYAYVPFGGGRRTCIGRDFALLEATLVLARIGQDYQFDWMGEDTNIMIEPEITTQTKNGLPMKIRER